VLLDCHDLRKTYTAQRGKIHAVDDIDLEIQAGEFLAVCGRSGSGKSTLLGMVGGLCRPSTGSVRIEAVDLWALRPGALAEFRARRIGFMFQFAGLLPSLRAIDNIAVPALLAGVSYEQAYARARGLLGQVGLSDRWDAYPDELSGGQQRRVALARALVNEPLVLLADEPTNDLDEQTEREIIGLLHELRRLRNTTMIVVTHDPQLARKADRVIFLRCGKLAKVGVPEPAPQTEPALPASLPMSFDPEPPAPSLVPAEPTPLGDGWGRFLVGFIGWALLIVVGLWGIDYATAWFQRQAIEEKQAGRKKAQELALQQLRADLDDVIYRSEGDYEVRIYLQNFDSQKPFYVLGPSVRIFVQSDRNWQEVPASAVGFSDNTVHDVTKKDVFRVAFRADLDRYDELMKGYMHVRITNVMVVSETAEPTEDLFQRTDDYYVYLKPQKVSEDDVRKRNGWKDGALVPRWMGMPAH
jgi:putative ABC transport system ATP-binding protein/macrolide transport system ATP-binding/permease protein/lipoprotein-releasing system ATP-binding protein